MEKERLSKVLARAGVASRRACEALIFEGRATVDGEVVLLPQTQVGPGQKLAVDGRPVSQNEEKFYFLLNKPCGYHCTSEPERKKRVIDLFKKVPARLFTVGRLDRDTTGLLLVTNDGHFANSVIHPSSNLQKEYVAKTDREITADHLKAISSGALIEGKWISPLNVSKVRKGTVKVVVAEGKKREVRILLENAGLNVRELKRVRIGGLQLGSLPEGAWRPLNENERRSLFQ